METDQLCYTLQNVYATSALPTCLLGEDLMVRWANDAALALYPTVARPGSVRNLLSGTDPDAILVRLMAGESLQLDISSMLPGYPMMCLTPIGTADGPLTVLLHFLHCSTTPGPRRIDDVIAVFAHQLRTPLASIFGTLSAIERGGLAQSVPALEPYLQRISGQCYCMLRTSANITLANRYTHGASHFSPQLSDLCEFVRQQCHAAKMIVEDSLPVRFSFEVPRTPIYTLFEPAKIEAALLNLISNACKFRREAGAEASLSLMRQGDRAVLTVRDNGIGMGPQQLIHAMDLYYTVHPASGDPCGDGLGLSICNFVAAEHGGTLALRSTPGEGTTAVLTLPIRHRGDEEPTVCEPYYELIKDRFSAVHVALSDICAPNGWPRA